MREFPAVSAATAVAAQIKAFSLTPEPASLSLTPASEALRDGMLPKSGAGADLLRPKPLSVNLCGCLELHDSFEQNEVLLPAVEVILEVAAHPELQLDAHTLKGCRSLKHVRLPFC